MTVIAAKAYENRFEIAVDRIFTASSGEQFVKEKSKLYKIDDCYFALTGASQFYDLFEEFIEDGGFASWKSELYTAKKLRYVCRMFCQYCLSQINTDKLEANAWVVVTPDAVFNVVMPDLAVSTITDDGETTCQGSLDVAPKAVMLAGGSPADACAVCAKMYTFVGKTIDTATVYRRSHDKKYVFSTCPDPD